MGGDLLLFYSSCILQVWIEDCGNVLLHCTLDRDGNWKMEIVGADAYRLMNAIVLLISRIVIVSLIISVSQHTDPYRKS